MLPAWARGDYVRIGQAARERTDCMLLGYTPGTRQLKKTMEDTSNLHRTVICVLLLCEHAIVLSGSFFRRHKVKDHAADSVVAADLEKCCFSQFTESLLWHSVRVFFLSS
jgi:hypothetical protein